MEVPREKMYKKTIIKTQSAIDVNEDCDEFLQQQRTVQQTGMKEKDNLNVKNQKFTVDITVEEVKEENYQFKSKQKIIHRKRMWQVLESISKNVTGYADRQLAVEVRNTWGRLSTTFLQDSAKENKLQQALLKWQDWFRSNVFAHIGSPVFYKCYICSKGWWRLYLFREHIETHEEVLKIRLETTSFESSIVAYVGIKPLKKTVHVEGNCLKCSKGIKDHKFYRCYVCQFAFGNCTALYRHDCRKMQSRRGVILESLKLKRCSICGYKCKSLEMYNHKLLIHTVPSDEPVDFSPILHRDCGMTYVCEYSHACPVKAREIYCNYCPRKFHNSSLLRLHMDIANSDIKCQICSELLPRQCMLMEHLSAHSEQFAMVAKCAICTVPIVFPDDVSAKHHMKAWHDKIETRNRTYHDMVIVPKIVVKKWWNMVSLDPMYSANYKEEDAVHIRDTIFADTSDDAKNEIVQSNHVNDTLQNNTEADTDVDTHNGENVINEMLKNDLDQEMSDDETNENVQSNHVNETLQKNTEAHTDVDSYNGKTNNIEMLKNDLDQEMSDDETNENVQSNHVNETLQKHTEAHTDVDSCNGKTNNIEILRNDLDQKMSDDETSENVQSNHVNETLQKNTETHTDFDSCYGKTNNIEILRNDLDQEMSDDERNENCQREHINDLQNNTETDTAIDTFNGGTVNNEILINDLNGEVGDDFDMHTDVEDFLRNPVVASKTKYLVKEAALEEKPDAMQCAVYSNQENEKIGSVNMADMQPVLVSNDSSAKSINNILHRSRKCTFQGIQTKYVEHKKSNRSNTGTKQNDVRVKSFLECSMMEFRTEEEYNCTKCEEKFVTFQTYVNHFGVRHMSPDTCPICGKCTRLHLKLSVHIRKHIIKSFQVVTLWGLTKNGTKETVEKVSTMYKCEECKELVEKSNFFAHWERHLCIDVNAFGGNKKLSNNKTLLNTSNPNNLSYLEAAIYKQGDTITDNDKTNKNTNISMNSKNSENSNSTHNDLNDEYSELVINETSDDGQKEYIEIEIMGISHFDNDTDGINNKKESNNGVESVQQISEDCCTRESSVGNNVKIENVNSVYVKRPRKSEEVTNEYFKNTNENLQTKKEIGVDDEDKNEKIVGNETSVKEDLSIVKQEIDNRFQVQIDEDNYNVDKLKIKKEVDDCNELKTHILEATKLRNHFEADNDTNIGLIIKTEIKQETNPKDDIQSAVETLRLEQKRKCRRENAEHSEVCQPKRRSSLLVNTMPLRNIGIKMQGKASENMYNCTKCLRKFDSFHRYVDHFFLHDIKPNTCPLCDTTYESVTPLCNHIRKFHIATSFLFLRKESLPEPENVEQKDKTKMFKCLVCENRVLKPHCFHHWEKHFNFKVPKRHSDKTSLDKSTKGRKVDNVFGAKVPKKFKGMNDTEKDAIIIDKGIEKSVQRVNSNFQNNIETDADVDEKKSSVENQRVLNVDGTQDEDGDFDAEVGGSQGGDSGRDALRHVDYKMKYYDADEDSDTVVVVLEEQYDNKSQRDYETMKELVERKEYYCTMCDVMFWSLQKYVEHLGQQHTSTPNVCPKCAQVCLNVKHFYGHVRRHIINSFQRLNISEEMDEKMSKMLKCAECYLMVEKSRCFAHWEEHLSIAVNTFEGKKELPNNETPPN